ncbi:MAG: isoprenylcysteine carboxylmethyltransferase family protein [Candidatus Omnitrophica bacterium]|nr:isoprenylcysteine carboxylmethyltransferase family protein [Candidatus Omnitrophota bacterium]
MNRIVTLIYGVIGYFIFFATFAYFFLFIGNLWVPKTVDSGIPSDTTSSIFVNVLLIALFGIQHSVMARPTFKKWWTQFVPKPIERTTFVILTSLILILLYWKWQPIPNIIWNLDGTWLAPILWGFFWLGFLVVLLSSFTINHFDLFGLRQVWLYFRGRDYAMVPFKVTGFYKYVRNPLMLGFLIAMWVTPVMTVGHLIFALSFTIYIFIGIYFEERNIAEFLGEGYKVYRTQTSMILPSFRSEK